MTSRAARATGLLAAAGLACGGCTLLPQVSRACGDGRHDRAPRRHGQAQPSAAAVPLASLLPFPPARLRAAASLASRFTAAWDSWSWRQPPAAWLAALQPMAAASLEPAQAAGDRGVLAQRTAARQVAVATVTGLAIRDLTPGSVTVTATVTQVITGSSGTSRTSSAWAVTLTPDGSGWLVWTSSPPARATPEGAVP